MSLLKRVAPIFPVRELNVSLGYYEQLGFTTRENDGGGYGYAVADDIEIHLGVVENFDNRDHASAYLFVEDAELLAARWRAAGIEVHRPQDTEWGQHEGAVVDPDGNAIRFGSPITRKDL